MQQEVDGRRSFDALGFADVATDDTTGYASTAEIQTSPRAAAFAGSFGHLSMRVARTEGGQEAKTTVVETAK